MDVQTIIVSIIIMTALFYVGAQIRRKAKAFSPKGASCGSDCGCDASAKAAKTFAKN